MNTSSGNKMHPHGFKAKAEAEFIKAFQLSIYFATWFCALTFLASTSLDVRPIPLSLFGFALIKAALCAKFMIVGEAIFPIKINKNHGIVYSLFLASVLYLLVVVSLNYLEAGIHGLIKGKEFITSLTDFGQSNPLHVVAMSIVYWLIVWPYLLLLGFKLTIGSTATLEILFGKQPKSGK
ncbi:hypothetical protein [Polynucleobacter sp. CS-Odin-A6]|uniref:hypothetical protein n=1 Tax=Polynucleobacter sp. CS-Odin-A6 TaxID=2689106 RepID=UPI001C0AF7A0|nr:hypothetical protein [Polynucleobacter sp. CS-Odin-A6]MBU3621566.1 hypothetical protein [Polynucleobacter sp. CS-Odin-A6]